MLSSFNAGTVWGGYYVSIANGSLASSKSRVLGVRCGLAAILLVSLVSAAPVAGEPIFLEAESFECASDGWKACSNAQSRRASRATTLHGATGAKDAVATASVTISDAGRYQIWVRHMQWRRFRGPFRLAISREGSELAGKDFDLEIDEKTPDWEYRWDFFDAELPVGEFDLVLSKYQNKNCTGYVRHVDCVFVTSDTDLVPNHLQYGPQTYLRVTLGEDYERPVYVHVFADHYRSPWYGHYHLSHGGAKTGLRPTKQHMMQAGQRTPWCNITPILFQDTGAILNVSARYTYHEKASRLVATFEFATAPDEDHVVRTVDADCEPGGMVIVMPPDLTTPENLARMKTDRQVAEATGRIADAYEWPTFGKMPERFPFFVAARIGGYGLDVDDEVSQREQKTLDYFGFSNRHRPFIHGGIWYGVNDSYSRPDVPRMKRVAADRAEEFRQSGKSPEDIAFCMLMDEPGGQPASRLAGDEAYIEAFRVWIKELGRTPDDLLVGGWDQVKPVPETKRHEHPALHYYTQRFRTRALGDFMAVQRGVLEEAYGTKFPAVANFSDGAIYLANFYAQGVDYFELLDDPGQNAIWGEDWANLASTYQCASYNVDLMRAAARARGQTLGHYLIAYAGRTPCDIQLKATSEVARGVKILKNFFYGPSWGSHEGGPLWRSSAWYAKPETWRANAEIVRLIGGAEDFLVSAMPAKADVAILYSSSSDIWTLGENYAFGFDRMHTWLALTHAQIPVDIVSEKDVADGELEGYKVCYLSGPNLTGAAAESLRAWVQRGGTLWLTAGAAERDEYNRTLTTLDDMLPAKRQPSEQLQKHLSAGRSLYALKAQDRVTVGDTNMEVLSVRQRLSPRSETETLGTFDDGSAALVRGRYGSGSVYCAGLLPALAYIKPALVARNELAEQNQATQEREATPTAERRTESSPLDRSYNPWQYPSDIRQLLLRPVRQAAVDPPLCCSVPLVDAVYMTCPQGILVPLANYTLNPLAEVSLDVRVPGPVLRVESVRYGELRFNSTKENTVQFTLPLDVADFVKIHCPRVN